MQCFGCFDIFMARYSCYLAWIKWDYLIYFIHLPVKLKKPKRERKGIIVKNLHMKIGCVFFVL